MAQPEEPSAGPLLRPYFQQMVFRMRGAFDPVAFGDCWQRLVARQYILRTVFRSGGDTNPSPDLFPPVPAEAPAYIIYTSGTTGQPKGGVSHGAVDNYVAQWNLLRITRQMHPIEPIALFTGSGKLLILRELQLKIGGPVSPANGRP